MLEILKDWYGVFELLDFWFEILILFVGVVNCLFYGYGLGLKSVY